jgi:hypothetical protein
LSNEKEKRNYPNAKNYPSYEKFIVGRLMSILLFITNLDLGTSSGISLTITSIVIMPFN